MQTTIRYDARKTKKKAEERIKTDGLTRDPEHKSTKQKKTLAPGWTAF
jgi:hypothetical protein